MLFMEILKIQSYPIKCGSKKNMHEMMNKYGTKIFVLSVMVKAVYHSKINSGVSTNCSDYLILHQGCELDN